MLASIYASSAVSFLTQPLWMINTRVQLNLKTGGSVEMNSFRINRDWVMLSIVLERL